MRRLLRLAFVFGIAIPCFVTTEARRLDDMGQAAAVCPCSLWSDAVTPSVSDGGPDNSVELGVTFNADTAGTISALRFYKSAANLGPHVGSLWSSSGALLAQVTFTNETAAGWQQAALPAPVAITAGTSYVASYHANAGHYAYGARAFATGGVDNPPLHAPAVPNGVFHYGTASAFPDSTAQSNYWVDVVFTPAAPDRTPPTVTGTAPANGAAGVGTAAAVTATFSKAITAATLTSSTFTLRNPAGTVVSAAVTYDAVARLATLTPLQPLAASTTYTATITGGLAGIKDLAGNALVSDFVWSFTTGSAAACPCTIWAPASTPAVIASDPNAVELGVRFQADSSGTINGIRFYKGAGNVGQHVGNLWSASGTLLASVTFTGESASGWQQALFSAPVPITANTPYIASYHTASGNYAVDAGYFALGGVDRTPLHAPADIPGTGNGVFVYGPGGFPNQTYNASNYWVDVVFAPPPPSDTTPPTVAVTAPPLGAVVSGVVTLAANASDNVGVAGVQFTVDGAAVGAEVTTAPYTVAWTTSTVADGRHVIGAVARDAAGNRAQASGVPVIVSNVNTGDLARVGQWAAPIPAPTVAVHLVMLPNGHAVLWNGQTTGNTAASFFDPATDVFTPVQNITSDMFCAGHTLLSDGRLIVTGGNANVPGLLGIQDTNILDPVRHSWTLVAPMAYRRWYPTATALPDGRVLVTSGGQACETCIAEIPEIYDPLTNTWTQLPQSRLNLPLYPFMFVLPDGRILNAGGSGEVTAITRALDLRSGAWTTIDANLRDGGSAAMYMPGKIIKSGTPYDDRPTGTPASTTTWILDTTLPSPMWRQSGAMAFPRAHHNLTILPGGAVLATGGALTTNGKDLTNAVYDAEIWSPLTEQWTTVARMQTPRLYHSTALLLPDGRVMLAGGGAILGATDEQSAEIYSPPYLFKGPRPAITAAPSTVGYLSEFFVATPDAASITSVSAIRLGAVTHSFNESQNFVPLAFQLTAGGLMVRAPANANTAPPGPYMLFLVNANGVPSYASIVQFPSSAGDVQAPTAPTNLVAAATLGKVTLTWTASTDNVAVSGYDVYRSTSPGVALTATNHVGQTGSTTYVDTALTQGTYVYVVTARDAAGNVSLPSNEAPVVVQADTTPPTVAVTNPPDGASLSGTVTLSATASDNVGVAGVQFKVDGVNVGAEVTAPPYTTAWNTASGTNGAHTLTAVARDAAGNRAESVPISVFVTNANPTPGLVAAYSFNESAGRLAFDSSGNGNTGTIASAQRTSSGRFGNALAFDGVTSWVTVNDNSSLELTLGMTVEAWVYPTQPAGWGAVVLKERQTVGLSYGLYASDDVGAAAAYVNNGLDQSAHAAAAIPQNAWSHLAMTYDGATVRLFINGQLASQQPTAGGMTVSVEPLRIGGDAVWGEYFSGMIDEVRIYNRALDATEIQVDMVTPITP